MTTATNSKTNSKTEVKTVTYGEFTCARNDYAKRWQLSLEFINNSKESLDSKLRDLRAQIVMDMKADNMTETQIAKLLEITKAEVQKLVVRGLALNFGLDSQATQELVNVGGNGITKARIESIVAEGLKAKATKADIKAELVELGLPDRDTARRDVVGGKPKATKASKTAKDIKAIQAIVKRATNGETDALRIFDELMKSVDEVGSLHANQ